MLIDNENKNKKVYEWINDYSDEGTLDIVTGYFTVGALAFLAESTNDKIKKYRFILGDIVNSQQLQSHTINLLNENIDIEASLKLKSVAIEAVEFLRQDKVKAKTLEPNFCHAKAYIFNTKKDNDKTFLMGSSNLTEAGIGLKHTNNIELNIAETGNNYEFQHILEWFKELWDKPQAHAKKTVIKDGKETKQDLKEYLIEQIEKIFIEYSPEELYYKILYELFGEELLQEQNDPDLSREIGKLENSVVYNTLYPFQKKGVLSLIKMLQNYNGAILADAVGLGKTWSALAVMKYFQLQGYENILLCPKKLENNWQQYIKRRGSLFEADNFEFIVRFHTDLFEKRLEKDGLKIRDYFQNDKPKLIIIDESHNLRNAKSNRYKFLVDTLLKKNQNVKVLLLSATPINNSLTDIRNQFSLLTKNDDHGFYESLGIRSIEGIFRTSQAAFNRWAQSNSKHISTFIKELPKDFFRLTDALTVARTRKMIDDLDFPNKKAPLNYYISPEDIGDYKTFADLFNDLPPRLAAYKPAFYIDDDTKDVTHNEKLRDKALVKMIYMLFAKRFESSWSSFFSTVLKVKLYHENIYQKALEYQEHKTDITIQDNLKEFDSEDIEEEEFIVGKREIKLSEIDACGYLDDFIEHLNEDILALTKLTNNLNVFKAEITSETTTHSKDTKLEKLIEIIKGKSRRKNKKLVIFTAYTDTAVYLEEELSKRGIKKMALVHGGTKHIEPLLQRFAPYTKLFNEKQWNGFDGETYDEWLEWIKTNRYDVQELLDTPIDVLVATDVLSEGQNLQDADLVINYDIHWNPVRVIQRMGRIDRIGSPNKEIYGINFWPSKDINDYLNLQNRIEEKMATMKIVGSEVDVNFTESLKKMAEDENLEQTQTAKMLKQMQTSWDDIEVSDSSLGFNDLSLEVFRQDLYNELQEKKGFYENMPKGIFTGFAKQHKMTDIEIVALLKNRETGQFELVYIDSKGKSVLQNQKEVLDFLALHKTKVRKVPSGIDKGKEKDINELQEILQKWAKSLSSNTVSDKKGNKTEQAGSKAIDLLNGLKVGQKQTIEKVKKDKTVEEEFDVSNYDLVVWFIVR